MRDQHSILLLQELHPKVSPDFQNAIEEVENVFNLTVRIIEAYRPWEKQAAYYAIGRTVKGENASPDHPMGDIITNAPPGSGYHLYRIAADIGVLKSDGEIDYNYDYSKWANIFAQYNISWGGNFPRKFKDYDHWENRLGHTWHDLLPLYQANKFIQGTQFLDI